MAIFGLGSKGQASSKKAPKKQSKQPGKKSAAATNSEAKAILAKMQAKKDAGDCPFC